jgi:hypothetical protein
MRRARVILAGLLAVVVLGAVQVAGALTGNTSDPDDSAGAVDVSNAYHSDDATNVTLGFQTFEDFTNAELGSPQQWDLDLDGAAGFEDCILVVKVGGTPQAELYNDCGTESFAQYAVSRPLPNKLELSVPIADLKSIGLPATATQYNYTLKTKDASANVDTVGSTGITHTFGPDPTQSPTPTSTPTPSETPIPSGVPLQTATDTQGVNAVVEPPAGVLSINAVADGISFGNVPAGTSKTTDIGDVNSLASGNDWTVTVKATSLVNGANTITFTNMKFKPGATITRTPPGTLPTAQTTETTFSGTDTTPGTTYSNPVTLATAASTVQGSYRQSGSTMTLSVPSSGVPVGNYAGTLQYTITG